MTDSKPDAGVSALVVARNEQDALPDCLASLAFADEIVVVLDRSTDNSAAIAREAGATLIEGAWEIEGDRRNLGIERCRHDWVLEIDADERATPALEREVRARIADGGVGYYLIPIRNFIGNREVRYGWGAYNGANAAIRLFTKGAKIWGPQRAHPKLTLGEKRGRFENGIVHYVDRDLTDMFDRMNRYSTLMAEDAFSNGQSPRLRQAIRRLFSRFFRVYVGRKGYREGAYGLALAYFASVLPLLIYLKVRELQMRAAESPPPR